MRSRTRYAASRSSTVRPQTAARTTRTMVRKATLMKETASHDGTELTKPWLMAHVTGVVIRRAGESAGTMFDIGWAPKRSYPTDGLPVARGAVAISIDGHSRMLSPAQGA